MKYKVTIGKSTFEVEIEDITARPIVAIVDGERFEVWPEGEPTSTAAYPPAAPVAAEEAALDAVSLPKEVDYDVDVAVSGVHGKRRSSAVLAPIPGTIVSIAVKPGQAVTVGQELCVLDAMKMQSPIRATRAGTIEAIHIAVGDNVKHHQLLMEYAD